MYDVLLNTVIPCLHTVIYTHVHPHTLPPVSKNREDTDNTPISPSVKNILRDIFISSTLETTAICPSVKINCLFLRVCVCVYADEEMSDDQETSGHSAVNRQVCVYVYVYICVCVCMCVSLYVCV